MARTFEAEYSPSNELHWAPICRRLSTESEYRRPAHSRCPIPRGSGNTAELVSWFYIIPGKDNDLWPTQSNGDRSFGDRIGQTENEVQLLVHILARNQIGRDDLRWHDLRHSGGVLAAATGASLAELMARLGHSISQAAMRY